MEFSLLDNNGNDLIKVHQLAFADIVPSVANDIFEILNDEITMRYVPTKYLEKNEHSISWMFRMLEGSLTGEYFCYLITELNLKKTIGFVMVISQNHAEKEYIMIKHMPMIEYYLNRTFWDQGIMSYIIGVICNIYKNHGIGLGAVTDRDNISSIKLLEKNGFENKYPFDNKQDFYELIMS